MKPEPIFAVFYNINGISEIHLFCKQLHQINTFFVQNCSLESKMTIFKNKFFKPKSFSQSRICEFSSHDSEFWALTHGFARNLMKIDGFCSKKDVFSHLIVFLNGFQYP